MGNKVNLQQLVPQPTIITSGKDDREQVRYILACSLSTINGYDITEKEQVY